MRRIFRMKDLPQLTGLSRSTIYSRMREGHFPMPIPLGATTAKSAVGWREDDLLKWEQEQVEAAAKRDAEREKVFAQEFDRLLVSRGITVVHLDQPAAA